MPPREGVELTALAVRQIGSVVDDVTVNQTDNVTGRGLPLQR